MIQKFVDMFTTNQEVLRKRLAEKKIEDYAQLVKMVVEILAEDDYCSSPDPDRITVIDHGDYQGTLLFVIGDKSYQPSTYWTVKVSYGSCSGCDTLCSINDQSYCADNQEVPTETMVNDYMTLCLHIVQGLKEV